MKVLLAALVLLAFAGEQAKAATVIQSDNPRYQLWVDSAKVPTPDVSLEVIETRCPTSVAMGCTQRNSFTIWLDPFSQSVRTILYHELGHNFDYYSLTDSARLRYMALTEAAAWNREQFAAVYAQCAKRQRWEPRKTDTQLPELRSFRTQRAACRLIRAQPTVRYEARR